MFRLNGDDSIQMVTALVLQLIQCSVKTPEKGELGSGTDEEGLEKVLVVSFCQEASLRCRKINLP